MDRCLYRPAQADYAGQAAVNDGKTASIMVTESGKNDTVVGRDNSYRPVVISGKFGKYARVEVEIVDSAGTYLIGRPLAS